MLIEFRVANFRSFAEECTFSMLASAGRSNSANVIKTSGYSVLRSAVIFGANASGKSNLVDAIQTMRAFIVHSATSMTVGDEIHVEPFALDQELSTAPTLMEATVLVNKTRYTYGFTATKERVHDEWLVAYPRGRPQKWLERRYDPKTEETSWTVRQELRGAARLLRERTRSNGLALARGAELGVEPLEGLFLWFKNSLRVLDLSSPPHALADYTYGLMSRKKVFRAYLADVLRDADTGIEAVRVEERRYTDAELPPEMPESVRKRVLGRTYFEASTRHSDPRTGESADFPMHWEANGSRRLVALTGPLWDTLQNGYTLIVDEFDCSMHPLLVRKLIELFHASENASGAQLVLTTHDSTLLDRSLFRRDQVWLVDRNRSGASSLTSLHDFAPRKDEAIRRRYLDGRYGGVPIFGRMLEDL